MTTNWDKRFLLMARHVAAWSKDPSTKCGAIIVDKFGTVVSQGYNGFARGAKDSALRYEDREYKYDHVIHAEMNAIINARQSLIDHRLYVWPMLPCIRCAVVVAQTGITKVVSNSLSYELTTRWRLNHEDKKSL